MKRMLCFVLTMIIGTMGVLELWGGERGFEGRAGDEDGDGLTDEWEKKNGAVVVGWGTPEQFSVEGYRKGEMRGWWRLDDAAGSSVAKDWSNQKKDLVVILAPPSLGFEGAEAGEFGYGHAKLDGGRLGMSVSGAYDNLWEFTYSAWVRSKEKERQVVGRWRDAAGGGWELGINEGGRAYGKFEWVGWGGKQGVELSGGKEVVWDGKSESGWHGLGWHHLVLVKQGEVGRLYVDGKLEGSVRLGGSYGSVCADFLVGGAVVSGVNDPLRGELKEVRLYGVALGGNEVKLLPNVEGDPDGDGLDNYGEYEAGSDPWKADSDGDGLMDGLDPLPMDPKGDYDGDGLSDEEEVGKGLDPENWDSDGDGAGDGWEEKNGLDPMNGNDGLEDADGDGASNAQEYGAGTDPRDYFNGDLSGVEVSVVSGNKQVGVVGKPLGMPVVLKVEKNGVGMWNAPVGVSVVGPSGEFKWIGSVGEVRTNSNGEVSLNWTLGEKEFYSNGAVAKVQSGQVIKKVGMNAEGVPVGVPLEGLKMWINGEKLGVEGEKIGGIKDWSANGNDVGQVVEGKKPEVKEGWNGRKVMSFDGEDDELDFAAIGGNAATIVMVYEMKEVEIYSGPLTNLPSGGGGNGSGYRVMAVGPNPAGMVLGDGVNDYVLPSGGLKVYQPGWSNDASFVQQVAQKSQMLPSGPELQVWESGAGGVSFYRGGEEVGVEAGNPYAFPGAGMSVGGALGRAKEWMKGEVGEVMVWDRELSEEERVGVEGYLKKRYGLGDEDGDGVASWQEKEWGLDPQKWDSNGDGVKDGIVFEYAYGWGANGELIWKTLDGSNNDVDGDGLSNAEEYALGTNVWWEDSDGDGVIDGADAYPLDPSAWEEGMPSPAPVLEEVMSPSGAVIVP